MTVSFSQMKAMNKAAGKHWFDEGAMRFFNTKLIGQPTRHNLFLTSETDPSGKTFYTVRMLVYNTADVVTVGPFHGQTLAQARKLRDVVSEALDMAANREKAVLEALSGTAWESEGHVLRFYAWLDGEQRFFDVNVTPAGKGRRICG